MLSQAVVYRDFDVSHVSCYGVSFAKTLRMFEIRACNNVTRPLGNPLILKSLVISANDGCRGRPLSLSLSTVSTLTPLTALPITRPLIQCKQSILAEYRPRLTIVPVKRFNGTVTSDSCASQSMKQNSARLEVVAERVQEVL